MSSSRRRRRGKLRGSSEINLTPLIDVALVLLVVFMITAPILQGGVEIRVPRAQVRPITSQEASFIVNMLDDGTIVVGETPIPRDEFDEIYPQLYEIAQPQVVYLKVDGAALYGVMAPIFAKISNIASEDGASVALIMEPEEPNR